MDEPSSAVPDPADGTTRTAVVTRQMQRSIRKALLAAALRQRKVWPNAGAFGVALLVVTLNADPEAWGPGAASAIAGFAIALLYQTWPRGRWLRAVYAVGDSVSTTIGPAGLVQGLAKGTSSFAWSYLARAGSTSEAVVARSKGSAVYVIPMELVGNVSALMALLSSAPTGSDANQSGDTAPLADDRLGPAEFSIEPTYSDSLTRRVAADFGRFARRRPRAWILPGVFAISTVVTIGHAPVLSSVLLGCAAALGADAPLGAGRRARRVMAKASQTDPVTRFEVSERGMRFIKAGARHGVRWSAYRSIWAGADAIVLRQRDGGTSVFPAEAIPEPYLSMARAGIKAGAAGR